MKRISRSLSVRALACASLWLVALFVIALGLSIATPAHAAVGLALAHTVQAHHTVLGSGVAAHLLVTGMIVNAENISGLTTSFETSFNRAFAAAPSKWQDVAMRVPSGTKSTTYAWLGMSTRMREWLGDRIVQNLREHGFTITNKRFESTVGVSRDDIADDQYGVYTPLFEQLGYDAKVHPDELLFGLVKNAAATKCYDGQNFFDTDHPVEDENGVVQSVSNFGGGAGAQWILADLSKPVRPFIVQVREDYRFTALDKDTDQNVFSRNELLYGSTGRLNVGVGLWQLAYGSKDTLDAAHYAAARAALFNMTADRGKKLNVTPTTLIVPPTLEGPANALVKAQKDAYGADNIWFGTASVVVVPWLE